MSDMFVDIIKVFIL